MNNLQRPHSFEPVQLEGQLPRGLRGTLVRAGPGLFERDGVRVEHPFEADGAILGLRLDGEGGAEGALRYVRSAGFEREEAAGRFLTGAHAPIYRRLWDMVTGQTKNTGNTSMMLWQQRLFALMEAGKPVELDPEDLSTVGDTDLDVIRAGFSAHPHRHPARDVQLNFGVRFGPTTWLDLYALPDAGPARTLGSVRAPWPAMVHDFALTEHYMVFVIGPAVMLLGKAVLGLVGMNELFDWRPQLGTRVLVVPLDAPEQAWHIEADPCWVWHVANGYEQGDSLVVEVCQYPDADSLGAVGSPEETIAPPRYVRWVIDTRSRTARSERAWQPPAEFPSVPKMGLPTDAVLLHRTTEDGGRQGLSLLDPERGLDETFLLEPGQTASEPLRVDHDGGSHVLLAVRGLGDDHVAVLDAACLADGPVAKVRFGQPLPMSFHGLFASA